jgi:DNA mismatch endonuclease (patch repair protein)
MSMARPEQASARSRSSIPPPKGEATDTVVASTSQTGKGPGDGYPYPSSEAVTKVMRGNRGSDTSLEVRVRSVLHRRGLRFRKQLMICVGDLRVRADVAFPRQRLAVFLDGCFWHRCPEHGNAPRANSTYWSMKLDRNVERDLRVLAVLRGNGWTVLRIWEHVPPGLAAEQIQLALNECKVRSDGR